MKNKMIYILNLPNFKNVKELSSLINISEYTLNKIIYAPEKHYVEVKKIKKNGQFRVLACPSKKIKAIQAWILRYILDKLPIHHNATAYKKDKNLKYNLEKHSGNNYFLCLDIENFFPSITSDKVYSLFRGIGYEKKAALLLRNICTYKGGLPQGGVTSPILSNILNIQLDRRISGFAGAKNIKYTRYADDITLSCNNPDKLINSKSFFEFIIKDEGYSLNQQKMRLLRPGNRREITGLVFSDNEEIRIGKKRKRELRAKIHQLSLMHGRENQLLFNEKYNHIMGWMSFLKDVDIKTYNQLMQYSNSLERHSEAAADDDKPSV